MVTLMTTTAIEMTTIKVSLTRVRLLRRVTSNHVHQAGEDAVVGDTAAGTASAGSAIDQPTAKFLISSR